MKKIIATVSSIAFLLLPASSFAAVVTINGFNDSAHNLATTTGASTMHLKIVSTGGGGSATHTFQWDNSPWTIAQGGTGTTTFATGSLLFYGGSTITEDNANLFWDSSSKFLGLGTKTPSQRLEIVGNIKLSGTLYAGTSVAIGTTTARHALDVAGAMYSELVTTSSSVNWNAGNVQTITLSTSPTLTFSNGQAGGIYKLILKQDGTGGRTVTWPATVMWTDAAVPTLSSGAHGVDIITFVYDGTTYFGSASHFGTPGDCAGGTITHSGGYTIHSFTTSGTLDCSSAGAKTANVLVVGGGGGGAGSGVGEGAGGGGGAGGMITESGFAVAATSYAVTVGSGGAGGIGIAVGSNGSDSVFSTLTAVGGGGGGILAAAAGSGGSGGGAGHEQTTHGTSTPSGQGNDGGDGAGSPAYAGGGGGGAGSAGANATAANGANGGNGLSSSISGSSVTYAGGGGSGVYTSGTHGNGGTGGGGDGGAVGSNGSNGTANTGGGGGSSGGNAPTTGGSGGSGIVIISYQTQ
jgi:hypothetical protein